MQRVSGLKQQLTLRKKKRLLSHTHLLYDGNPHENALATRWFMTQSRHHHHQNPNEVSGEPPKFLFFSSWNGSSEINPREMKRLEFALGIKVGGRLKARGKRTNEIFRCLLVPKIFFFAVIFLGFGWIGSNRSLSSGIFGKMEDFFLVIELGSRVMNLKFRNTEWTQAPYLSKK